MKLPPHWGNIVIVMVLWGEVVARDTGILMQCNQWNESLKGLEDLWSLKENYCSTWTRGFCVQLGLSPFTVQIKTQLAEFQNLILYLALLSSSDVFHRSLQVLMYTLSTSIFFPLLRFFLFHVSLLQVPLVSLFFCFKLPLLGAAPFRWSFVAGYGARGPHRVTLLNIRFDLVVILDFFFGKMIFIYQIEWAPPMLCFSLHSKLHGQCSKVGGHYWRTSDL